MTAVLLGAVGCAGKADSEPMQPDRPELSPGQIYALGEARYSEGYLGEAVELWKHSLVALPPNEHNDELRHKLVLRIAHGQLMKWSVSNETAPLRDAQAMLYRYLEKHEALFGDSDRANRERSDVYEILYEVETRLPGGEEFEAAQADGSEEVEEVEAEETETATADAYVPSTKGEVRKIKVKTQRPSVDDPEMRAKLRSEFANPENGYVLAAPELVTLHDTRVLVRGGPPRVVDGDARGARKKARRAARSLVDAARADLEKCFTAAISRFPEPHASGVVQLSIDDEGAVSDARFVDGGLIDFLGDVCVMTELESTTVPDTRAHTAMTITVPLTFLVEEETVMYEGTGRSRERSAPALSGDEEFQDPAQPPGPKGG